MSAEVLRPPAHGVGRDDLASIAQVRAIYTRAEFRHDLLSDEVVELTTLAYRRRPEDLSVREAAVVLDRLARPNDPMVWARNRASRRTDAAR